MLLGTLRTACLLPDRSRARARACVRARIYFVRVSMMRSERVSHDPSSDRSKLPYRFVLYTAVAEISDRRHTDDTATRALAQSRHIHPRITRVQGSLCADGGGRAADRASRHAAALMCVTE